MTWNIFGSSDIQCSSIEKRPDDVDLFRSGGSVRADISACELTNRLDENIKNKEKIRIKIRQNEEKKKPDLGEYTRITDEDYTRTRQKDILVIPSFSTLLIFLSFLLFPSSSFFPTPWLP